MSQEANIGTMVTFTCNAIAFPTPSYSWTTPITNSNFNTSTINITANNFGNFTCMADSNGTIATSQPALLTSKIIICKMCVCVLLEWIVIHYVMYY